MSEGPVTPRRHTAPPLSVGRSLGDFQLVGVLGEGGTGIVYEATKKGDDRRLALKVIHGHLLYDKQIRGRFTREANILRRLQGVHLCPVIEYGELPDPRVDGASILFIALPKIDGPALDQLLREEGPITIDRALDITLQVCSALASAHAQGVIHRDLKPANVLLEGGTRAVVVDFGMAKIVTGGGTDTTGLTAHNMVFGTPEYMAPEQARGDELDARCDVYAVGAMLYELLTGHVPFTGNTPLNVLTAQLTEAPKPPRERAPERGISIALEAVVLTALAKDPLERYPTAQGLALAIQHAKDAPEDVAGVVPRSVRPEELGHAETLPAPAPASLVRASRRTPVAAPAAERAGRAWWLVWVVAVAAGVGVGVWLSLRAG